MIVFKRPCAKLEKEFLLVKNCPVQIYYVLLYIDDVEVCYERLDDARAWSLM